MQAAALPPVRPSPMLRSPGATAPKAQVARHLASMLRPAAFFYEDITQPERKGGCRLGPEVDVPVDAPWAAVAASWKPDPRQGLSPLLQLNLQEVPAAARDSRWPAHGIAWVLLDGTDEPRVHVLFDPRPAQKIVWRQRWRRASGLCLGLTEGVGTWEVRPTLPCRSAAHHKELWDLACARLATQASKEPARGPALLQVGGWVSAQEDAFARHQQDLVCSIPLGPYGRGIADTVHVRFNPSRGFYGDVQH